MGKEISIDNQPSSLLVPQCCAYSPRAVEAAYPGLGSVSSLLDTGMAPASTSMFSAQLKIDGKSLFRVFLIPPLDAGDSVPY